VSEKRTPRALIIGGSISGLFAALLLRRTGWEVEVFERSEAELAGRGAGIVTHVELRDAIRTAGPDPDDDLGLNIEIRRMFNRAGKLVAEQPRPQIVTSWDRMFRVLKNALPAADYNLNKELTRCETRGKIIAAHFADGSSAEGDLLVGADGIRSSVRAQYLPEAKPLYADYVAWRGLVPENEISAPVHEDLFEYFSFCLPDGEQMLGYPVAGPNNELCRGDRRYNFVWYRPADGKQLKELLTDKSGHIHQSQIPPPLIKPENIEALRSASEQVLSPQFQEMVALTPKPFLQPIYDLESPKMVFGRVAILGDAAFVARPHVGAGVAKAAADAMALATALQSNGDDVVSALCAFESQRIGIGQRIIERARHLGAYIQAQLYTEEEQRFAARYRSTDAVMRETASMDFLRN
jgi:2-polyprenyl-6-methoxyphenol hydroxylase-like FAD-dependent oxidoreductase